MRTTITLSELKADSYLLKDDSPRDCRTENKENLKIGDEVVIDNHFVTIVAEEKTEEEEATSYINSLQVGDEIVINGNLVTVIEKIDGKALIETAYDVRWAEKGGICKGTLFITELEDGNYRVSAEDNQMHHVFSNEVRSADEKEMLLEVIEDADFDITDIDLD